MLSRRFHREFIAFQRGKWIFRGFQRTFNWVSEEFKDYCYKAFRMVSEGYKRNLVSGRFTMLSEMFPGCFRGLVEGFSEPPREFKGVLMKVLRRFKTFQEV